MQYYVIDVLDNARRCGVSISSYEKIEETPCCFYKQNTGSKLH